MNAEQKASLFKITLNVVVIVLFYDKPLAVLLFSLMLVSNLYHHFTIGKS